MLVLRIKKHQKIIVDEKITIWINKINRKQIALIFDAPASIKISLEKSDIKEK